MIFRLNVADSLQIQSLPKGEAISSCGSATTAGRNGFADPLHQQSFCQLFSEYDSRASRRRPIKFLLSDRCYLFIYLPDYPL